MAADQRTDQIFNNLAWGLDVCRRVNSPRFKIVYDIYHVQISDGDVTRNLRDNFDMICHIHVAGVPGRNEIDETQEINYPAVMKAIVDTGFKGHVAQEFIPARPDVLASLKQGVDICDV